MRKTAFLSIALSVAAIPALAQFQQVVEVRVKAGHEIQFESYIKKVKEAADKTGASQGWAAFQVTVGKEGPLYRVALPFAKWSERDAWASPRGLLVGAFGEQEGSKIHTEGTSAIVSTTSRIWEIVGDASASAPTTADLAPHYEVMIRHVKPEMVGEYRGLLRRFKAAYDAQDDNPNVTRWILRFGPGNNVTFRRTQPLENWAVYDSWNAADVIAKHFGDDAPLLFERLNNAVWKSERFVSTHRPDLSRPAVVTSND